MTTKLLAAARLALQLIQDTWPLEHGQQQVGKAWGALEEAIAEAEAAEPSPAKPYEPSVDIKLRRLMEDFGYRYYESDGTIRQKRVGSFEGRVMAGRYKTAMQAAEHLCPIIADNEYTDRLVAITSPSDEKKPWPMMMDRSVVRARIAAIESKYSTEQGATEDERQEAGALLRIDECLSLVSKFTGGKMNLDDLTGDKNNEKRRLILSALLGRRATLAESGINRVVEAVYPKLMVQGDCLAARRRDFIAKAKRYFS